MTLVACAPPSTDSAEAETADPKTEALVSQEEQSIDRVVAAAYAMISFEPGATPDYAALQSIFTPTATMINFDGDTLNRYTIDAFIAVLREVVESGQMNGFREIELGGETEYFSRIAHRISAYASYYDGAAEVGDRGVNSFQLLKLDGRWLINSIIWDVEREDLPIPERYLSEE